MKWLKDDAYNAMKQAADNWNKLLNQVLGDAPEMKVEEVTVEVLLEAFEKGSADAGLQEQLATAQNELKQKNQQVEQLQSDLAELKGTPVTKQSEARLIMNREPEQRTSKTLRKSTTEIRLLSWLKRRKQDFLHISNRHGKTRIVRY